ncbi:MAG: response regulator [Bacteroidota bacterium]|nr:response regulator [Bacteroidota bacterium]
MKEILLIEDDYLDVESVKRALKKIGVKCNLSVAHNGVDGLTALTGNDKISPDLIILDINMPKMNGVEFLNIIKSYYSLKNIKTFILTTSVEEYDKLAIENLGVHGYILKPLDFKKETTDDTRKLLAELLENN